MLYLQFIGRFPQRSVGGLAPPSYEYAVSIPFKAIKFRHYQNTGWPLLPLPPQGTSHSVFV